MQVAWGTVAAVCVLWLAVVMAHPGAQQRHKQPPASPMGAQTSVERRVGMAIEGDPIPPALEGEGRPLRETEAEPRPGTDRSWLRFFNNFMNNQKVFRGRTKKVSKGCFGNKMDRIGSMSNLGC